MKLICPISAIEYSCTYFGGMKNVNQAHPIFDMPIGSILSRAADFRREETSREEKRLIFLATLNASGLIEWRSHAAPTDATILQHYNHLVHTVGWLSCYDWDRKNNRRIGPAFPKFAVTQDTKSLSNIFHWLEAWTQAKTDYDLGTRRESTIEKMKRREAAILKMLRNPEKTSDDYAWLLAQWAADAAEFPSNIQVNLIDQNKQMTLREYWILLMTDPNFYGYREQDYQELIEHLEDNLEHGSSYAHATMKLVRSKIDRQNNSLGLGDIFSPDELDRLNASPFTIIQDSIETDNKASAAIGAPIAEPLRPMYPNQIEYLKARAKWILAQAAIKQQNAVKNEGGTL